MDTITAATIEETMKTGLIVEARTLLTLHESALSREEWQTLDLELKQQQAKAEAMIAEAEALEISGKTEEAKAVYESILLFASDFSDIQEQIKRLNEALLLTKAVKRRSRRIRETSSTPKEGPAGKRFLPLLGAGLAVGLTVAVLFLVVEKPQPQLAPPPEKTLLDSPVPGAAQQPVVSPTTPVPTVTAKSPEVKPAAPPAKEKVAPAAPIAVVAQQPVAAPEAPARPTSSPPEKSQDTKPAQAHPAQTNPSENIVTVELESSLTASNRRKYAETYTVQSGDSLSLIAHRQLCYEDLWRKIYQLNREQITDPRKLQPGMILRLNGIENRCPATDE